MSSGVVQLSCLQCSRRKIRCNKAVPCSGCIDSSFDCIPVQRRRRPRGRTSKVSHAKDDLKARISQLEAAVAHLKQSEPVASGNDVGTTSQTVNATTSPSTTQPIAADFWFNITSTVDEIRDILEGEEEDEDGTTPQSSAQQMDHAPSLLDLFSNMQSSACFSVCVTPQLQSWLKEIYAIRFDPMLKIVDWHAEQRSWNDHASGDQAVLQSAILFAASVTLLPHEVPQLSGGGHLVGELQQHLETQLNKAGFTTSTSFKVLQAFVLYLAALRATKAHAKQWALLPLTIRLATVHGIPGTFTRETTRQNQIPLRLWFSIGMLDLQSAFDRGTQPFMSTEDFTKLLPMLEADGDSFTSMTTSLMMYKAMLCQRAVADSSLLTATCASGSIPMFGAKQNKAINDFEQYVEDLSGRCSNTTEPLQAFTMAVARGSLLTIKLLTYRPLYKVKPEHWAKDDDINVLESAMYALQSAEAKNRPDFMPWAWYAWVKWYVLAIVLAELCHATLPWDAQSLEAWRTAEVAYARYATEVLDAEGGLLWRPIVKLHKRVQKIHEQQHMEQTFPDLNHNMRWGLYEAEWMDWGKFLDDVIDPALLFDYDVTGTG